MNHAVIHIKDSFPLLGANGCDPTLTLYLPYNLEEMGRQDQKRPTILLCPGGGYRYTSERETEPMALKFLGEGYNVCVLDYSVSPHHYPTQIRETAAAMELIHHNAAQWNVDTERVVIMGCSAGAHLAAHYSNAYACTEVREVFPKSKRPKASILCYPVITADAHHCHKLSIQRVSGHEELTEADIARFSCERLVTEDTPPAFIWHTTADQTVPVMNSLLYAQALTEHKIPYALHIYPAGRHGLSTVDAQTLDGTIDPSTAYAHEWLTSALHWLQITL